MSKKSSSWTIPVKVEAVWSVDFGVDVTVEEAIERFLDKDDVYVFDTEELSMEVAGPLEAC